MTSSGNRVAWNANNRPPVAARHDAIQRPFKLNSWCPQHSPLAPNECHKSTAEKPFSDEKLGGALLAAPALQGQYHHHFSRNNRSGGPDVPMYL